MPVLLPAINSRGMEAAAKPPRLPLKADSAAPRGAPSSALTPKSQGAAGSPAHQQPPQQPLASKKRGSSSSPGLGQRRERDASPAASTEPPGSSSASSSSRGKPRRSASSNVDSSTRGSSASGSNATASTSSRGASPRRGSSVGAARGGGSGGGGANAGKGKLLFVIQYGNNSPVLRQLMRARTAWAPGPGDPGNPAGKTSQEQKRVEVPPSDDCAEVQFIWTQYPVKSLLSGMASHQRGLCVTLNEEAKLQGKFSQAAGEGKPVTRMHNHFEGGSVITSKAGLRTTMVDFYLRHRRDPFGAVPLTYVVREGTTDPEFVTWRKHYDAIKESKGQAIWLVKPGDKANRGNGIRIYDDAEELGARIDSKLRPWVVQKYMEAPLLVHRRKFDIRAYCLVTQEPGGGTTRAYFYPEAYLRTTSAEYSLKTFDKMVHLNNDAVQKAGGDYGKFEAANKLSLAEFQQYLDKHHSEDGFSVKRGLLPQIRSLMADTICAAGENLNPRGIDNCFEVFGFDFMVDASFRPWLIEVNSNPCLELCNSYLSYLIPKMLDEALQMTLDQVFPQGATGGKHNAWELIYDSQRDPDKLQSEWVEQLPAEQIDGDVDLSTLGGGLLACELKKTGAGRKRSRGPKKSKEGA